MALYRIDGFDYWSPTAAETAVNAYADAFFNGSPNVRIVVPGRFDKGESINANIAAGLYQAIGKRFTSETCVVGQACYIQPGGSGALIGKRFGAYDAEGGGDEQWYLRFEETGVIRLYVKNTGDLNYTLMATTPADTFHVDQWFWLEVKFLIHPSAGMVEVRVNTVTVMSYVGRTAGAAPVLSAPYGWDTLFYVGESPAGFNSPVMWDDRYILDDTGTNNTDYLGNVRVNLQLAIAAGDLTDFSVFGAGSNWDAVNGKVLDDTEYVYSGTVGDEDLYTFDPNVVSQNILGLQIRGAYRQDDATQVVARNIIKTGGTIYEGDDKYLTQNYTYYRDMWELNPDTGVGWTAAEVNAIQAGTKVQAIG